MKTYLSPFLICLDQQTSEYVDPKDIILESIHALMRWWLNLFSGWFLFLNSHEYPKMMFFVVF